MGSASLHPPYISEPVWWVPLRCTHPAFQNHVWWVPLRCTHPAFQNHVWWGAPTLHFRTSLWWVPLRYTHPAFQNHVWWVPLRYTHPTFQNQVWWVPNIKHQTSEPVQFVLCKLCFMRIRISVRQFLENKTGIRFVSQVKEGKALF